MLTESGEVSYSWLVSPSVHVNVSTKLKPIQRKISVDFVVLDSGYGLRVVGYVLEGMLRD